MQVAGRYETLELLGSGGMGEVYLALDRDSRGNVALKLLKEDVSDDIVTRFDRECSLLERMTHPAVVRVLDRGSDGGRVFYTMEHVPWPTLAQRMLDRFRDGGSFQLSEVLRILEQLAGALDHLHGLDVVHRDLKPSNLLVSDELDVRVIDFGLAGMLTERMTRTGAVLGSMLYLSPEQVKADKSLDTRSDIFQVGLILYELLTGRKAYTNVVDYVRRLRTNQPPFTPIDVLEPKLSKPVADVVMRALAVPEAERHASAGELFHELAAAAKGRPSRRVQAAVPPPSPPKVVVHKLEPVPRPWLPGLLLAGVLVFSAAASFVNDALSRPVPLTGLEVTHGFFRTEMRWRTPGACPSFVVFSREGETDLRRDASTDRTHVVTLTELEPAATYRAQVYIEDQPAGPPVAVTAPGKPGVEGLTASPAPDGTLVSFRTPVPATASARWKGAGGETGSIESSDEPSEQHRLLLSGFRPGAPFALELRLVSRLGEIWTARVDQVAVK